jgi:hypothetical protein
LCAPSDATRDMTFVRSGAFCYVRLETALGFAL